MCKRSANTLDVEQRHQHLAMSMPTDRRLQALHPTIASQRAMLLGVWHEAQKICPPAPSQSLARSTTCALPLAPLVSGGWRPSVCSQRSLPPTVQSFASGCNRGVYEAANEQFLCPGRADEGDLRAAAQAPLAPSRQTTWNSVDFLTVCSRDLPHFRRRGQDSDGLVHFDNAAALDSASDRELLEVQKLADSALASMLASSMAAAEDRRRDVAMPSCGVGSLFRHAGSFSGSHSGSLNSPPGACSVSGGSYSGCGGCGGRDSVWGCVIGSHTSRAGCGCGACSDSVMAHDESCGGGCGSGCLGGLGGACSAGCGCSGTLRSRDSANGQDELVRWTGVGEGGSSAGRMVAACAENRDGIGGCDRHAPNGSGEEGARAGAGEDAGLVGGGTGIRTQDLGGDKFKQCMDGGGEGGGGGECVRLDRLGEGGEGARAGLGEDAIWIGGAAGIPVGDFAGEKFKHCIDGCGGGGGEGAAGGFGDGGEGGGEGGGEAGRGGPGREGGNGNDGDRCEGAVHGEGGRGDEGCRVESASPKEGTPERIGIGSQGQVARKDDGPEASCLEERGNAFCMDNTVLRQEVVTDRDLHVVNLGDLAVLNSRGGCMHPGELHVTSADHASSSLASSPNICRERHNHASESEQRGHSPRNARIGAKVDSSQFPSTDQQENAAYSLEARGEKLNSLKTSYDIDTSDSDLNSQVVDTQGCFSPSRAVANGRCGIVVASAEGGCTHPSGLPMTLTEHASSSQASQGEQQGESKCDARNVEVVDSSQLHPSVHQESAAWNLKALDEQLENTKMFDAATSPDSVMNLHARETQGCSSPSRGLAKNLCGMLASKAEGSTIVTLRGIASSCETRPEGYDMPHGLLSPMHAGSPISPGGRRMTTFSFGPDIGYTLAAHTSPARDDQGTAGFTELQSTSSLLGPRASPSVHISSREPSDSHDSAIVVAPGEVATATLLSQATDNPLLSYGCNLVERTPFATLGGGPKLRSDDCSTPSSSPESKVSMRKGTLNPFGVMIRAFRASGAGPPTGFPFGALEQERSDAVSAQDEMGSEQQNPTEVFYSPLCGSPTTSVLEASELSEVTGSIALTAGAAAAKNAMLIGKSAEDVGIAAAVAAQNSGGSFSEIALAAAAAAAEVAISEGGSKEAVQRIAMEAAKSASNIVEGDSGCRYSSARLAEGGTRLGISAAPHTANSGQVEHASDAETQPKATRFPFAIISPRAMSFGPNCNLAAEDSTTETLRPVCGEALENTFSRSRHSAFGTSEVVMECLVDSMSKQQGVLHHDATAPLGSLASSNVNMALPIQPSSAKMLGTDHHGLDASVGAMPSADAAVGAAPTAPAAHTSEPEVSQQRTLGAASNSTLGRTGLDRNSATSVEHCATVSSPSGKGPALLPSAASDKSPRKCSALESEQVVRHASPIMREVPLQVDSYKAAGAATAFFVPRPQLLRVASKGSNVDFAQVEKRVADNLGSSSNSAITAGAIAGAAAVAEGKSPTFAGKVAADAALAAGGTVSNAAIAAGAAAAKAAIREGFSVEDVAKISADAARAAGGSTNDVVQAAGCAAAMAAIAAGEGPKEIGHLAAAAAKAAGGSSRDAVSVAGHAAAMAAIASGKSPAEVGQLASAAVLEAGGSAVEAAIASNDASSQAAQARPSIGSTATSMGNVTPNSGSPAKPSCSSGYPSPNNAHGVTKSGVDGHANLPQSAGSAQRPRTLQLPGLSRRDTGALPDFLPRQRMSGVGLAGGSPEREQLVSEVHEALTTVQMRRPLAFLRSNVTHRGSSSSDEGEWYSGSAKRVNSSKEEAASANTSGAGGSRGMGTPRLRDQRGDRSGGSPRGSGIGFGNPSGGVKEEFGNEAGEVREREGEGGHGGGAKVGLEAGGGVVSGPGGRLGGKGREAGEASGAGGGAGQAREDREGEGGGVAGGQPGSWPLSRSRGGGLPHGMSGENNASGGGDNKASGGTGRTRGRTCSGASISAGARSPKARTHSCLADYTPEQLASRFADDVLSDGASEVSALTPRLSQLGQVQRLKAKRKSTGGTTEGTEERSSSSSGALSVTVEKTRAAHSRGPSALRVSKLKLPRSEGAESADEYTADSATPLSRYCRRPEVADGLASEAPKSEPITPISPKTPASTKPPEEQKPEKKEEAPKPEPPAKGKGKGDKGAPLPAKGKGKAEKKTVAEPRKPDVKPGVQVKRLFWNSFRLDADGNSVWGAIDREGAHIDIEELEACFADEPIDKGRFKSVSPRMHAEAKTRIQVLDGGRRRQICVALARLPEKNATIDAVHMMDTTKLNKDQIELLLLNVPSAEEIKILREAEMQYVIDDTNVWDTAEDFIFALIAIPQFQLRLAVWGFKNSFQDRLLEISQIERVIADAFDRVMNSKPLRHLLGIVLYVGNYLNGGTSRGRADGFTIDTLSQMRQVKMTSTSADHKGTLVDYIVRQMEKHYRGEVEEILGAGGDAEKIHIAAKKNLGDAAEELNAFRANLDQLNSRVKAGADAGDDAFARNIDVLASYVQDLDQLQGRFQKLHERYQELCVWFHMVDQSQKKTTEEFFTIWDKFLQEVVQAQRSLEKQRLQKTSETRRKNSMRSLTTPRTMPAQTIGETQPFVTTPRKRCSTSMTRSPAGFPV